MTHLSSIRNLTVDPQSITNTLSPESAAKFNASGTKGAKKVSQVVGKLKKANRGQEIEITLDHLPYRELSPNARVHWVVKNKG